MLSLAPITLAAALLSPGLQAGLQAGLQQDLQFGDAPAPSGADAILVYSAGIDALLAAPKDSALAEALELAAPRLIALLEGYGVSADADAINLAHGLLTQPFCLRLGQGEGGRLFAQLTVRHDNEADAHWAAETLARFAGQSGLRFADASEGTGGLVAMTPVGPLTIDAGTGPAGARLAVSFGAVTEETFMFTDTGLPAGLEPNVVVRVDGARLGSLVAPFVGMLGKDSLPVVPRMLFELLQGPDAPSVSYASAADGSRGIAVLRSLGGAAVACRMGTLVEEPLGVDDFARIPADATWARMAQWRPAAYLDLLDRFGPGMVDGAIGQIHGMSGVDLRADLLDHIGPTLSAYTSRSTGGGIFSAVALLESDDSAAVARSFEGLWALVEPMVSAETEGHVDVRTWESNGVPCATIVFPGLPIPVEPSFAAADGVIVCALSRNALTSAVEQLGRDKGLASHTRLASMPARAYEGLAGFGFYDTPRFVLDGYGTLAIGASALANAMHEPGNASDLVAGVLPTPRTLAAKVRPSVSFMRIKGDDIIETTTRDASFLVRCAAGLGGPLGESQVLTLGIPIVASIAIPNLLSARQAANENAATATLRSIAAGQAQFQATGLVDTDGDGGGEYGFLSELCGSVPLRVSSAGGGVEMGTKMIDPPILAMSMAPQTAPSGAGVTLRSGYVFQVWLPDADMAGVCETGAAQAGPGSGPSSANAEVLWCAYAWPLDSGKSGGRAFCITQDGDIFALENDGKTYSGLPGAGGRTPAFDAALAPESEGWSLTTDERFGPEACLGSDGNVWSMIGW